MDSSGNSKIWKEIATRPRGVSSFPGMLTIFATWDYSGPLSNSIFALASAFFLQIDILRLDAQL
jgi:hypothetical protein